MTKQMTVDKHLRRHLRARAKTGESKYGVPLLPFNGRNPLKDKREELLDALVYNEQDILEREQMAVELEEVRDFLYNFRQSKEIESADLDRAIAHLDVMAKRLTEDTERIEPKEEPTYIDPFKYSPVLSTMFGPDPAPVERMSREEARRKFLGLDESHCRETVPLEPVLASIRADGPIGHRDLLELAAKHPAMERLEQMECGCCGKCVQ